MYDIKKVILKMKQIAGIETNADLARLLNISYNTLNTWIKRDKLPQEILLSFCKEYKCSLDYLLLDINGTKTLFDKENHNSSSNNHNEYEYIYYGKLNNCDATTTYPIKLLLNRELMHSNGEYLLYKNNIYIVVVCKFDIFNKYVYIKSSNNTMLNTISLEEFNKINKGLIIKYKK